MLSQAYTYELEKEKNQLIEENQKLRKILQGQQVKNEPKDSIFVFFVSGITGIVFFFPRMQILSAFAAVAIEEKGAPKKRNRFRSLSALF